MALPRTIVCPECGGEGCKDCDGRGVVELDAKDKGARVRRDGLPWHFDAVEGPTDVHDGGGEERESK